jgi:hypothetical protein
MDADKIVFLLRKLRCTKIRVLAHKGWVESSCPLARWEHAKGRDEHPSFGVKIKANDKSYCRCQACGVKGDLLKLLMRLHHRYGVDCTELVPLVKDNNTASLESLERKLKGTNYTPAKPKEVAGIVVSDQTVSLDEWETIKETVKVLPEDHLAPFRKLPSEVLAYLTDNRKLTRRTIERWEVGWHPGARRIVIPIRDVAGRLVGISGRAFDANRKPKYLHSKGFRKDFYLYGEHLLPEKCVKGNVVEGFFDVMYMDQCGFPTVAVMGSYVGRIQMEKLVKFFEEVTILPDGDAAGEGLGQRFMEQVSRRLIARCVTLPSGKDPDDLPKDQLAQLLA